MNSARRLLLACCVSLSLAGHRRGRRHSGFGRTRLFTLAARDGGKVRLADLKGQVVMINFWATWCGPCRQEMPLLAQLSTKYEPLGFTLLGVNVEPDSAAAVTWLKGMPVTFPDPLRYGQRGGRQLRRRRHAEHGLRRPQGPGALRPPGYKPGDEARYADMIRSLVKE